MRMDFAKQCAAALLMFAMIWAFGILALDAWQWEYFGDCNGCILLDKFRDL